MPDRDCRLAISILFSFSFPARRSFEGTRNGGVFSSTSRRRTESCPLRVVTGFSLFTWMHVGLFELAARP